MLWGKIKKIHVEKSHSVSHLETPILEKRHLKEIEKQKEIKYLNRKMIENIIWEKERGVGKKELQKQIREYQDYKSLHLKIKGDGKEGRKKKTLLQQPEMDLYVREYVSAKK